MTDNNIVLRKFDLPIQNQINFNDYFNDIDIVTDAKYKQYSQVK